MTIDNLFGHRVDINTSSDGAVLVWIAGTCKEYNFKNYEKYIWDKRSEAIGDLWQ